MTTLTLHGNVSLDICQRLVLQGADYNKMERAESKRIGAKVQKNSGRGQIQKGDAVLPEFVIDYKFAEKSFTLNEKVWSKLCTDTMRVDVEKSPLLYVVLNGNTRLAVIEYAVLEDLIERSSNGNDAGND